MADLNLKRKGECDKGQEISAAPENPEKSHERPN